MAMGRAALVALLVSATAVNAQRGAPPSGNLTYTVRPLAQNGSEVSAVEVRAEFRGAVPSGRTFTVQAPIVYASVRDIADRIDSLAVRDAAGAVGLTIVNDAENPGGFPYFRHWRAKRAVTAPVVITYRMRPFNGIFRKGPQFDLYAHGGGISTAGMALFVVPEGLGNVTSHVRWDLSQLATGSIAASTYGEGDIDLIGPVDRITQAYYMAGPLGRYSPSETSGFHAHWLGQTQFDAPKEMEWAYQAYENLRRFHRDTSTATYNVFVRAIPGATTTLGGTALQNSFMVGVVGSKADTTSPPRNTIAHEMGHMFVGYLNGGTGGVTWFNEGMNVFYTRLLLMRAGLVSVDDYGRDINATAKAYYGNPYRNASADSLDKLGFSAGVGANSAQNVPYSRGSLFFADIDAKIRAKSNGTRKLDDVMLPLFIKGRTGATITPDMVISAFVKEVGPSARKEFEAVVIRGETLEPQANAFGPCFERRPTADGATGYTWVRVSSVPDSRCREW